jgi:hypothetical protein
MIIGDTDNHNKICGFRGGNGKYRLHSCRDCTVTTTANSDNPVYKKAKCEPCLLVTYNKPYLDWVLNNSNHFDGKLPNLPSYFDIKQNRQKYAMKDEWYRQISQNSIIPALMYHYFGGDLQGVHGATSFETINQFLIGMLPYILESLYNYRAVTEVWKQFLNKRTCPDVPEPTKKKHVGSGGEELPITDDDTHSEQQRYLHWQQSRPKFENQNRNIFSKNLLKGYQQDSSMHI